MPIDVNNKDRYKQYSAASSQTIFSYDFPIYAETDLNVYQRSSTSAASDSADILTLNVDYTVTGVGVEAGGTIVLTTGATLNDVVTIEGNSPLERTTQFTSPTFSSASVNEQLNSQVMMAQQNRTVTEIRAMRYPASAVIATKDQILPILSAGQYWQMNGAGTGISAVTLEEDPNVTTLRSELADQTNLANGCTLLGYYNAVSGSTTLRADLDALHTTVNTLSTTPTITNLTFSAGGATVSEFDTDGTLSANTDSKVATQKATKTYVDAEILENSNITQYVNSATATLLTATTVMPYDDTIPQNTEGDQILTTTITPKSATNTLIIEGNFYVGGSTGIGMVAGLFQDSTAGALSAYAISSSNVNQTLPLTFKYIMAAGTTSATTFKVRIGPSSAATLTINGFGGVRKLGGVMLSSLVVTEIKAVS